MTVEWHWRSQGGGAGGSGRPAGSARQVGPEHPTQGEAESWLGESYPDLLDAGVHAVSLYEGDRLVYGPMSLEPERG